MLFQSDILKLRPRIFAQRRWGENVKVVIDRERLRFILAISLFVLSDRWSLSKQLQKIELQLRSVLEVWKSLQLLPSPLLRPVTLSDMDLYLLLEL